MHAKMCEQAVESVPFIYVINATNPTSQSASAEMLANVNASYYIVLHKI